MPNYAVADFEIVVVILKRTYHLLTEVENLDVSKIMAVIADNVVPALIRLVKTPGVDISQLIRQEIFDDVISLLWQIAWQLKERGADEAPGWTKFHEGLQTLQELLQELLNNQEGVA